MLPFDPAVLQSPWKEGDEAPLWPFLDALHPSLWRKGRDFPRDEPALGALLANGETQVSFAFNPGRASAEIAAGRLPRHDADLRDGGRHDRQCLLRGDPGQCQRARGRVQVVANLLLAPHVQARAQDADVPGFQTVLDMTRLTPATAPPSRPCRAAPLPCRPQSLARCCWSPMPAG